MEEINITGYNNLKLFTRLYNNVKSPKGVVQIIHGMREHSGRYIRFAAMLENNGYIVYSSDSRGHGNTALSMDKLGHGETDIYTECVEDQILISKYIKKQHPNLPLYIFAHSFGSMIAQRYIQVCSLAEKVVLCGTNNGNNLTYKFGKLIANIQSVFVGKDKTARLIESMNKKMFASKYDRGNWLSRDEEIYDKYLEDPFCNALFPISFYKSLFTNMTKVNKNIKSISKKIKLLLIAGDNDPVGGYGKNVEKLTKLYIKQGLDATCKIYPGARHELHNELNKDEVDQDILNFYEN